MKELIERLRYPVLCTLDDRLEAADALERMVAENQRKDDTILQMVQDYAKLTAELASSRVGFTKVSPYEPGSRGRFSI